MDITSIANYAVAAKQTQAQQQMGIAMMKQAQASSETTASLVEKEASYVASSSVPTTASSASGRGSIIDITV